MNGKKIRRPRPRTGALARSAFNAASVAATLLMGAMPAAAQTSLFSPDQLAWRETPGAVSTAQHAYAASVAAAADPAGRRSFTLRSDFPLRDGSPHGGLRVVSERDGAPHARSGSLLFDGLFALAVEESRQNSVDLISDWSFDEAACQCFETGELWKYVWTRDISYSAHLSLAQMDPERALQSLLFKVSGLRPEHSGLGFGQVIVQDTGTGGSYPVSTDRVVWALAAEETLKFLPPGLRAQWEGPVLAIIGTALRQDRGAVYDGADGLYRGEQSFLDWREQSYPAWTRNDVSPIHEMKSLSTNVLHFAALKFAATLAGRQELSTDAALFGQWAAELKRSINNSFWREAEGGYAALIGPTLDPGPIARLDQLGSALAVLTGVADERQGRLLIANYPATAAGVPVIWPQQPFTPIYHNRAVWPFASAYWALAAKQAGNGAVFDHATASLMRGAALNLSNMENFDFLTAQAWLADGPYSGPVVNSRRQLWSVAGYLGLVIKGIAGLSIDSAGENFSVQPLITPWLRRTLLTSGRLDLENLPLPGGKSIDISYAWPVDGLDPASDDRQLEVSSLTLAGGDGFDLDRPMALQDLPDGVRLEVSLAFSPAGAAPAPPPGLRLVKVADPRRLSFEEVKHLWAPREPRLLRAEWNADRTGVDLQWTSDGEPDVVYRVWRGGKMITGSLTQTTWSDHAPAADRALCYTIEAEFVVNGAPSGHRSHRSQPHCLWPSGSIIDFQAGAALHSTAAAAPDGSAIGVHDGMAFFRDWGWPGQELAIAAFTAPRDGVYLVQAHYSHPGPVSTGVTAGVKRIDFREAASGKAAAQAVVVMPHRGDVQFGFSALTPVTLRGGTIYEAVLRDHWNMSYLQHFSSYTGTGGKGGSANRVNLAAVKILYLGPAAAAP